jgi:transcription antitermination factor NusG
MTFQLPIQKRFRKRVRLDGTRYYAVQILPQFRHLAEFHLKRQGFDPFFPELKVYKTKKEYTTVPLLKGYGFVKFDPDLHQWRSVNGTRGVISLVPKHKIPPLPMPRGFVEYLYEHNPVGDDEFDGLFDKYFPGMVVRFKQHHRYLGGEKAEVISVRETKRTTILEISFHRTSEGSNAMFVDCIDVEPVEGELV